MPPKPATPKKKEPKKKKEASDLPEPDVENEEADLAAQLMKEVRMLTAFPDGCLFSLLCCGSDYVISP